MILLLKFQMFGKELILRIEQVGILKFLILDECSICNEGVDG